jgi:hypothetical protein
MPVALFGAETVPSGTTEMELVEVGEVPGRFNSPALCWRFESADGRQAKKLTGTEFAADVAAGQFLVQLLGRSLGRGDRVVLDDLIGEKFVVTVSAGQIIKVKPVAKV